MKTDFRVESVGKGRYFSAFTQIFRRQLFGFVRKRGKKVGSTDKKRDVQTKKVESTNKKKGKAGTTAVR